METYVQVPGRELTTLSKLPIKPAASFAVRNTEILERNEIDELERSKQLETAPCSYLYRTAGEFDESHLTGNSSKPPTTTHRTGILQDLLEKPRPSTPTADELLDLESVSNVDQLRSVLSPKLLGMFHQQTQKNVPPAPPPPVCSSLLKPTTNSASKSVD